MSLKLTFSVLQASERFQWFIHQVNSFLINVHWLTVLICMVYQYIVFTCWNSHIKIVKSRKSTLISGNWLLIILCYSFCFFLFQNEVFPVPSYFWETSHSNIFSNTLLNIFIIYLVNGEGLENSHSCAFSFKMKHVFLGFLLRLRKFGNLGNRAYSLLH